MMIRSSSMTSLTAFSPQEPKDWKSVDEVRLVSWIGSSLGSIPLSRIKSDASMSSVKTVKSLSKDQHDSYHCMSRRSHRSQFSSSSDWDSPSEVLSWPVFRRVLSDTDIPGLRCKRIHSRNYSNRRTQIYSNYDSFSDESEPSLSPCPEHSNSRLARSPCDDGEEYLIETSVGMADSECNLVDAEGPSKARTVPTPLESDVTDSGASANFVSGAASSGGIAESSPADEPRRIKSVTGGRDQDDEGQKYGYTTRFGLPLVCNSKGCLPVTEKENSITSYADRLNEETVMSTASEFEYGRQSGYRKVDISATDRHYRKLLKEDPLNPLLLHNYARFLYEIQKNSVKAEEYYERAILASPSDGEILAQYAKLIWDVYRDQERASLYYDRAIKASPDNCFILAAYASFLWSIDSSP